MTRPSAPLRTRLPGASLLLGGLSVLLTALFLVWSSTFYAEAVFLPMAIGGPLLVIVSGAGVWVAVLALRRRARPRWMPVVGLIASLLPLLLGLYLVVGIIALLIFFSTPFDYGP